MNKIVYAILFVIFGLAFATSAIAVPAFTANDLEFGSDNQNPGVDVSQTLTLVNTGDQDLTLTLTSAMPTQYNVRFSQSTVSLTPGSSASITVTIAIPSTQPSGRVQISGGINVASNTTVSDNVQVFVETQSMLEIYKVTIEYDGDEHTLDEDETYDDEDLKAGTTGTLRVYVRNNFDINMDIEDIDVDVDADDLDVDESDELGDLEDGDKDDLSFDFEIPDDADDGDDFDIDVDVSGRDENGTIHRDSYSASIEINKEAHEISITDVRLSPQNLQCGIDRSTMTIEVENTGRGSEDNVNLLVESADLDIEQEFYLGDLDEEDTARKSFTIELDDGVEPGEYTFILTTYYDVDEESDADSINLNVLPCTTGTPTTGTPSTGTPGTQPTVPPIIVTSGAQPSYGSASFTDSPLYLAMLIAGVVVVAAILIILLVKFVF